MGKRRRRIAGLVPWLLHQCIAHSQPLLVFGLLMGLTAALISSAQRAEAFRITQVSFPPNTTLQLRQPLIGRNLWDVDIRALAQELHDQQPWLNTVRVVRELPNALRIDVIPRTPVAHVRVNGTWYAVDREGFLLPQARAAVNDDLMRFTGFERAQPPLAVGKINADERLALALRVRGRLQRASGLTANRITEINVEDPRNIRLLLDGATDVRCGSEEELPGQLERLRTVLQVLATHAMAARYIDVRFQEPVVGQ